MSPDTVKKKSAAQAILVDWTKGQDLWVQCVVGEILDTRKQMGETRVSHYYGVLLGEKGLGVATSEPAPDLAPRRVEGNGEDAFAITRLHSLENVNALAVDQEIVFNGRMTVLFGENGAGKSGYVRVLKSLASVRTAEDVLPNLKSSKQAEPPSAKAEYELGGKPDEIEWTGVRGIFPFTMMDVFDPRCVLLHVDSDLTYIYTPTDLALFRFVRQAIDDVRGRLDTERTELKPVGNPFLPRFVRGSSIYAKVETLGAATDLAELRGLAVVTEEEEKELSGLRERVDALSSGSIDARLEVARSEKTLYGEVSGAVDAIDEFDLAAYSAKQKNLETATERHLTASQKAFEGVRAPGLLGDAWRAFIEAGEQYINEHEHEPYPGPGSECVYCRQPLQEAATDLLRKYRDFCNDELRLAVDSTREELDLLTKGVRKLNLDDLEKRISQKVAAVPPKTAVPPVLAFAEELVAALEPVQEAVSQRTQVDGESLPSLLERVREPIAEHAKQATLLASELGEQAEKRKELLAQETAKLKELEARLTLREQLPAIEKHVEAARWAEKAGPCCNGSGGSRRL